MEPSFVQGAVTGTIFGINTALVHNDLIAGGLSGMAVTVASVAIGILGGDCAQKIGLAWVSWTCATNLLAIAHENERANWIIRFVQSEP